MSTRVISDRELLHETAELVGELREQVAALHLRLDRLVVIVDADAGKHSRRLEPVTEHTPDTTERLRRYLEQTGRIERRSA